MKRNVEEAMKALTEKSILVTSAERVLILNDLKSLYKELPQPQRFSKIFSMLMSRVSVPIEAYDLVAGRYVDRELTDEEEQIFQSYIKHPDYPSRKLFWSSGHCTYSWEMIVKEGIIGLKKKATEQMKDVCGEKREFLSALVETYDAISAFCLRYAEAAEKKGMKEVAGNLRKAALQAPDSFASALQLLWIITFINCAYISGNPTLTVGRMDRILYPFYQADLKSGAITREKAKDYITDYYCKHNLIMGKGEHQNGDSTNSTTFWRILNFDAPQYLLLAGTDEKGDPAVNELTELFAECIVPEFKNPVVVVRYFKNMDKEYPHLWDTLCRRALDSSSLMFYNDENVINTFVRIGLPIEDARCYAHFGCNWCSPGDNCAWMLSAPNSRHYAVHRTAEEAKALDIPYMRTSSAHSWPEDFMEVLRELAEYDQDEVSIDDFYQRFFERMGAFIDRKLAYLSKELEVRKKRPSCVVTYGDCFLEESINNAECFSAGAKYHFELQAFQMFGTVADCFIAVDQLVMTEKRLTMKRLLEAAEADFEGYSDVLAMCRKADKYGMDTPLSRKHVTRLSHTAGDLVIEKNKPYFEKERLFLVPCIQSDTWHMKYGSTYGATVDGRRAFTSFSQNSNPSNGACVNGITAMFNDMLCFPRDGLVSGALNLDIEKKDFEGENGVRMFSALLSTYLNQGGLHAQVTAVNIDDMIDAQINPHLHRELRVRVTGYSGIFVDICKKLQDDIIERMKEKGQ